MLRFSPAFTGFRVLRVGAGRSTIGASDRFPICPRFPNDSQNPNLKDDSMKMNRREAEPSSYLRPRAYEDNFYQWQPLPKTITHEKGELPSPLRKNAVFLVHGIGSQRRTETAVTLRSGFEDALAEIFAWQEKEKKKPGTPYFFHTDARELPPPFIYEGYWADYEDIQKTFPEKWKTLEEGEREFFKGLWKFRTSNLGATLWWFLRQQLRLLNPSIIRKIHFFAWLLYWPLQIVTLAALAISAMRYPKVVSEVLSDVRLYVDPKGIVERAIVQRVDRRVGTDFLKMLGLDWEFRPISNRKDQIIHDGKPIAFDRITWVAHSLGTVISYNVISDLFAKANMLDRNGDSIQKKGVKRFRESFRRFVTLGSPLDKIAFLFGEKTLRPWTEDDRVSFWDHSKAEDCRKRISEGKHDFDWWLNFYHVLDPVSGALSNRTICRSLAPRNFHISFPRIPGLAHLSYWSDTSPLRYILGRVYGSKFLKDRTFKRQGPVLLTLYALLGYVVWAGILAGGAWLVIVWSIGKLSLLFG